MLDLATIVALGGTSLAAVAFFPALHTKLVTVFKNDNNGRWIAFVIAGFLTIPVVLFAFYGLLVEYGLVPSLLSIPILWLTLIAGLVLNTTIVYEEGKTAARKKLPDNQVVDSEEKARKIVEELVPDLEN